MSKKVNLCIFTVMAIIAAKNIAAMDVNAELRELQKRQSQEVFELRAKQQYQRYHILKTSILFNIRYQIGHQGGDVRMLRDLSYNTFKSYQEIETCAHTAKLDPTEYAVDFFLNNYKHMSRHNISVPAKDIINHFMTPVKEEQAKKSAKQSHMHALEVRYFYNQSPAHALAIEQFYNQPAPSTMGNFPQ